MNKLTDKQQEQFREQMRHNEWEFLKDTFGNGYAWQHIQGKTVDNQDAEVYWLMSGKCPVFVFGDEK